MPEPVEVLSAMITPAVLISAQALLVLSTSARLGRVIDRIRMLIVDIEAPSQARAASLDAERHDLILNQLDLLSQRLFLLRSAITGLYVAIALLVGTSLSAGLFVLFPGLTAFIPIAVGLIGALAFLYSLVILVREATLAVRESVQQIRYVHALVERNRDGRPKAGQAHGE